MKLTTLRYTTSVVTTTTLILLLLSSTTSFTRAAAAVEETQEVEYGVDVSFPMHRSKVSTNYPWLPHNVDPENNPTPDEYKGMPLQPLGNVQKFYDDYVQGCRDKYGKHGHLCDSTESDRVEMSLRQPASMTNYTDIGFKKIKCPEKVWKLLLNFWEKNKDKKVSENWNKGNTYTNHWAAPTYMVSVENTQLRGGGGTLKQAIWDAARDTIQEWTGQELTQCSLYGIRVYTEGAVLATHVDRMPLISSAIVNVAQDVDEPWPIEVIGHDGKAHNVTMEPGDMVLYESHSILHGRPFPLKGRYFANVFIHFEPTGHTLRHIGEDHNIDVHAKYAESVKRREGGHENEQTGLPPYIKAGTVEAKRWKQRHPDNQRSAKQRSFMTGSTAAHDAARHGDIEGLKEVISIMEEYVNQKDSNGWTPLHEGARGGHQEVVAFLVESGANINEKTKSGETALWWAEKSHGKDHPIIRFMKSLGAIKLGPEL